MLALEELIGLTFQMRNQKRGEAAESLNVRLRLEKQNSDIPHKFNANEFNFLDPVEHHPDLWNLACRMTESSLI